MIRCEANRTKEWQMVGQRKLTKDSKLDTLLDYLTYVMTDFESMFGVKGLTKVWWNSKLIYYGSKFDPYTLSRTQKKGRYLNLKGLRLTR